MTDDITVVEAEDVDESLLEACWEIIEGWYAGRAIDWEDVLDRLERAGWDLTDDADTPAIRKLKRTMRAWRSDQA